MSLDSIHCLEIRGGIRVPHDVSVLRGVRSQMPVQSAGENYTRNRSDRGRLRRAAAGLLPAAGVRCVPDDLAGLKVQSEKSPAGLGVQLKRYSKYGILLEIGRASCRECG